MAEDLLALVPVYGLPILALVVGFGCMGFPLPSSLTILLGGSLVAAGEFEAWQVFSVAFCAAVAGDQTAFFLGRRGANWVPARTSLEAARRFLDRHGAVAVFFSRWLVAPLGPTINVLAGAAGMDWRRFTTFEVAGEVVWVALFMTLGFVFSGIIVEVADLASDITGFLAALVIAALLGNRLWKMRGKMRRER